MCACRAPFCTCCPECNEEEREEGESVGCGLKAQLLEGRSGAAA